MFIFINYSVSIIISITSSNPIDCLGVPCSDTRVEPFYCIGLSGECFLLPNECVLKNLQCLSPNENYSRDYDNVCGYIPAIY